MQLLGIDLGTTTFKAVVYGEDGDVRAAAAVSPPTSTVTVAGTLVDIWPAEELWSCICAAVRGAVEQLEDPHIDALAIVELGLIGLPLDDAGAVGYPPVAWMNPIDPLAGIPGTIDERAMFASTGNRLNPIYPPIWISWLRLRDDAYPRAPWKWLYTGDYLAYRMTGEVAVDYSMASQTLVLDQASLSYRADLLAEMGLSGELFPQPRNAGEPLGPLRPEQARELGLEPGTPVIVGGADFVTGSYASGMVDRGDSAIITGSWECTVFCSDRPQTAWAIAEVGGICDRHIAPGRWAVRIETFSGDITEWWRREGWASVPESPPWKDVVAEASGSAPGSGGVVFVPHLAGSYGPVLDERARGAFVGITNRTTRADLTRAVFEGLCFQSRHAVEALQAGLDAGSAKVVTMGGATKNPLWMQTRADVLGVDVETVTQPDMTPRGAAMIAGIGAGRFADFWDAARSWAIPRTTLRPSAERASHYDGLYRDVYRPLCDALAPFNHKLTELAGRSPGGRPEGEVD